MPPTIPNTDTLSRLSNTEREVLSCIGHAMSDQEIASLVSRSRSTIRTHVGSIMLKTQIRRRTVLVLAAIAWGLAPSPRASRPPGRG
jgi:DNA-binding NarL/FixJ family response regulator